MNRKDEHVNPMQETEAMEPELRQALGNFRSSVTAWSEAVMTRPREVKAPARTNWSFLTKWALGVVVFAGTVSGGLYQNQRQLEAARVEAAAVAATARAAEQQRELAAQTEKEQSAEDLMAKVDSDIAREVPSALEPMASMMTDEEAKGN
jgi:hypothetical protein